MRRHNSLHVYADDEIPQLLEKKWVQPRQHEVITHNINCEICLAPTSISRMLLKCVYCNIVCHQTCLQKFYKNFHIRDPKMWICFYCVDDLDDSRSRFDREHQELIDHDLRIQAQIIIAKYWRRFVSRCFYLRVYTTVVKLQIIYHVRHRKRDFMQSLQAKLRPIKIRIIKCSHIMVMDSKSSVATSNNPTSNNASSPKNKNMKKEHHFFMIVTVLEIANGFVNQTWRANTTDFLAITPPNTPFDLKCDEKVFLGGVSGFHTVVITLFQKGYGRDYIVGQVYIDLTLNFLWRRGGRFTLQWSGQDFAIKDYSGMELKADSRMLPHGSIEFEITTYHGMNSDCGHCMGTSMEDLIRMLHRLPAYSGYQLPHKTINTSSKKAEISAALGASNSYNFPMKRMWIAIAEGNIYVFNHFGDQLKLIFELSLFTPAYEYKEKRVIFKVQRNGYPDFQFHPIHMSETLRWKCAFLSSLRYHRLSSGGESFNMKLLVDDLIALETKLSLRRGYKDDLPSINRMSSNDKTEGGGAGGKSIGSKSLPSLRVDIGSKKDSSSSSLLPLIHKNIARGSSILSDGSTGTSAAAAGVLHRENSSSSTPRLPAAATAAGANTPSTITTISPKKGGKKGHNAVLPAEVMAALTDKVAEEYDLDDIVLNQQYQGVGEAFVQNILTSLAQTRIQRNHGDHH